MLNYIMQNDYLNNKKIYYKSNINLKKSRIQNSFDTKKVNINELLNRVKNEKKNKIKENWILVSVLLGVISVTGFIAIL